MIQGFGHGDEVIRHNPNWAEGIYVKNEKLRFAEGINPPPIPLAQPNVICTEHTDVLITDEHGNRYKEGTDSTVNPGDIDPYQPPGEAVLPLNAWLAAKFLMAERSSRHTITPHCAQRVVTISVSVLVNRKHTNGSASW